MTLRGHARSRAVDGGPTHLRVDGTGLRLCGAGEELLDAIAFRSTWPSMEARPEHAQRQQSPQRWLWQATSTGNVWGRPVALHR